MTASIPPHLSTREDPASSARPAPQRRRDAANTRRLLLDAARRRFATQGYAATTVREIADEAGVNVALISRYFESKEGLFEACLPTSVEEVGRAADAVEDLGQISEMIARGAAEAGPEGPNQVMLMLLLRSSGDERAERLRLNVLRGYSERLAAAAGRPAGDPGDDTLMLRAQLVLALSLGVALLRSSTRLEPLASATAAELAEPLRDLVDTALAGR
ncbi:TetR/AcrR family transcriptional regulator [Streptomyces sp. NPDC002574]|uniref:TetR/AcrR family transcriptional regulator n=1 Tax=Streptomyces sp. NPDC002574 TaxID=3364652 RepID=UPI0036C82B3C